jgi:uncharacterized protein YecE (DUF72 family)
MRLALHSWRRLLASGHGRCTTLAAINSGSLRVVRQHDSIRVGIGGWTFEPWRGSFYPSGLPQKRELEFASRRLTSIEVNGTYYGAQKPESFIRWREETPEGFVFSLKGPRFTTNRRALGEAGASIERFLTGGVLELKEKLGPINWQMMPTKQFDAEDFEAFLKLLPAQVDGRRLRHVVEVRHPSFVRPEFVALLRAHGVAAVLADHATHPQFPDPTAPFVYVRLQCASEREETGYLPAALALWAKRAHAWASGKVPADLPLIAPPERKPPRSREVFIYLINGFKPKAPVAAMALIERLSASD